MTSNDARRRAGILAGAVLWAAAVTPACPQSPAVTRQYVGVVGAHGSVELTLTFAGAAVSGSFRQSDGGPEARLDGRAEGARVDLRALDPAGREIARLAFELSPDGLAQGAWRGASRGQDMPFFAEEVANDLSGSEAVNGHYVREGQTSGGSLDLLLLDGGRVKVQGYASWAGAGGRAASGDVAGYAAWDGRVVRLRTGSAAEGCELAATPVEGGLDVTSAGRCPGDFAGRYVRRSSMVPDWETFHWAGP
jgi:hypothetical protein